MKKTFLILVFLIMPILLFAQGADFGDAPDISQSILWWGRPVKFPTLLGSNGPRHSTGSSSTYWIGRRMSPHVNSTTMEINANVIDNDYDDGQPFLFVWLIGIPAPATASVPITTSSAHNPNQDVYINVAIDVDNDMDFDGTPDVNWVVQNKKVRIPADTTLVFTSSWFGFGSDLLLFPVWLRVTVTDAPIVGAWQGQNLGSWTFGETEDWWYVWGRGGGGRGGGGGGGGGAGGGGGGGGNPPPGKCVQLIYPPVVYVHCDETKCFKVGVRDCGSIPPTNITVGMTFAGGTPLQSGPTFVPPPVQDGNITWFTFCITGWPCGPGEGNRWAKYVINLSYDPDNHTFVEEMEVEFRNDEDPIGNPAFQMFLGANPVDSSDCGPWLGTINVPMPTKHLISWTGHFQSGGLRWITGNPILIPLHLPSWATFTSTTITMDTIFWEFNGTPGNEDYGLDSAVFEVRSDNPTDMISFTPWNLSFKIDVQNITSTPEITTVINNTRLNVATTDSIVKLINISDPDIQLGRRDTAFIDYYLYDLDGDSIYFPDPPPVFVDSGNGNAYLKWIPEVEDIRDYRLTVLSWDYYYNTDSINASLKVVSLKSDFNAPIKTGANPLNIQFYDSSKAINTVIESWFWNFGDGETSAEQNPMHTYNNSGTFTVSLTIADDAINNVETKQGYIVVSSELLVDFTASSTIGMVPLNVQFTDLSTGGASTWLWDFGDGDTSTVQNPLHTYNSSGTFTVSLTVSDGTSEITATKENYIIVLDSLIADFTANPLAGSAPLEVTFTDQSIGNVTTWSWDFGDGGTSNEQNPVYTYNNSGTYTVALTVSDGISENTLTMENYIVVLYSLDADFTANPLTGEAPLEVTFTDNSLGNITSWFWDFGDGGTSTEQNPVHTYQNPGTYTVALQVKDLTDSAETIMQNYITVTESTELNADFSAVPLEGIVPLNVQFTDLSTGTPNSWLWDFGDDSTSSEQNPVHMYNTSGTYTVTLTVSDGMGQSVLSRPDYIMVNEPEGVNDGEDARTGLMNYPNPFGPGTTIQFNLDEPGDVSIEIFDVYGKLIRSFIPGMMNEGLHTVNWDGLDASGYKLSGGMYYCKLTVKRGNSIYSVTRKMVQVK